tara:strand:+ start:1439 stop:1705 length:267 start_codon:yes stop_codon:yes gene_type:complete
MKNIDFKSLAIGALLTTTIFLGIAATSNPSSQTLKLEGPIDLRLSFGGSGVSTTDSSTPTEITDRGLANIGTSTYGFHIKHSGSISTK